MMDTMRSMASGWIAKILMGLLVLSFAVWGIADMFTNFGRGAVATVGDTEINANDYRSELYKEVTTLSNRLNTRLTTEQTVAFGLPNQVLGRMINEATLNDLAKQYNLGLSSGELAKMISEEPAFQSLGRFDRNQMNAVLRNSGTTEDRYILSRESLEERRQLAAGLTGRSTIPLAALKVFNAFSFETRTVDYLKLDEADLGDIEDPDDATLKAYFEKQKLAFRAPEYRSFRLLKLEPGDIIKPDAVTDADARAHYETVGDRFNQPEKRQIQQILFDTKEEAEAALDKIKAGSSFDDIMAERNLTPKDVDFGLMSKEEITDPAASEAAFALGAEGVVTDVVEGRFGSLLLRVTKITPAGAAPFEDIKDRLKAEIAAERANGEVLTMFDQIEDERAGGVTLEEIAQKFNLPLRTVTDLSKAGELQAGGKVTDLPEQEKLLTAVFDTDVDYEADPIDIGNTGFAWFEVTGITDSRDRTLDEVRPDAIAAWKAEERKTRNATRASELADALKAGKSLDAVAEEKGLEKLTASGVTRQDGGDLPQSAVEQAFNGPAGYVSTAADGTAQYVLVVGAVKDPEFNADGLELQQLRKTLDDNASLDLLGQLSAELLRKNGFTVNEALLQQTIGSAR